MNTIKSDDPKYYKLNVCMKRFWRGSIHGIRSDEYPNILFSDYGAQTYMNCIGFIMGIYAGGNIDLAAKLADNLVDQFHWLANGEFAYAEVSGDNDAMSFNFMRYYVITEEKHKENPDASYIVNYAARYTYYRRMYNGGIIFHGMRDIHCLDRREDENLHVWSTHT